ncbi:MAG: hypothetical protein QGD92_15910, partial [Gammaproteobacteria bacterium]|nr:hypothetical protein [Gammaproteobacteria bacterium]
ITRAHLIELGRIADLKEQDAKEVIERVGAAIGNWQSYASEYGVSHGSNDMITTSFATVSR